MPTNSSNHCDKSKLPERLRVLFVTTLSQRGDWLRVALTEDRTCQLELEEVVGTTSAMARLREEVFDVVIARHDVPSLDALAFVDGLRTADHELAVVVLGADSRSDMEAISIEAGADAYCCVKSTTTRALLWNIARAIQFRSALSDNRRWQEVKRQRLATEHVEAKRLLDQQRGLVEQLESLESGESITDPVTQAMAPAASESAAPIDLLQQYRDLLQTYVVMGAGNLAEEMGQFVERFAARGLSAQTAVHMHVDVLEQLVLGLGNRSARHVMTRGDLLLVELVMCLADAYRSRYNEVKHPPQQQWLPGFDGDREAANDCVPPLPQQNCQTSLAA